MSRTSATSLPPLALSALLLTTITACGGTSLRRRMFELNRVYLSVHEHADAGDFAALQSDGARLHDLVNALRVYNDAADFQAPLAALAALATDVEEAGKRSDRERAKAAFVAMGKTCAECHRIYKK